MNGQAKSVQRDHGYDYDMVMMFCTQKVTTLIFCIRLYVRA